QKVAQYTYFEEIYANENKVVYNYTLSSGWAGLPNKEKEKFLKYLQTARNSLKHGQREVHRYFYEYPQSPVFELKVDEQICVKAGL
ncbi:MAG: hypothetical protein J6T36_01140, partial [Campylobacter sp.]|nr:hypothetical protein [Campylobacter sp.]